MPSLVVPDSNVSMVDAESLICKFETGELVPIPTRLVEPSNLTYSVPESSKKNYIMVMIES